jgi:hypothetical protein
MSYFNCGAYIGGGRPRTKKALKEALLTDPTSVYFDGTGVFRVTDGYRTGYRGNEIPEGVTLSVTGPNPYMSRKWWASITFTNGKVKVT